MKRHFPEAESPNQQFEMGQSEFLKWVPMLRRLGLKPRRLIKSRDAFFIGTPEGWYRLSLVSYPKEELKWLRNILEYLEERSFRNWAVPWQKTVIWEDNGCYYLIQPWFYGGESFTPDDPAALTRVAEILAEFHRSGRDYREVKGIEIMRDRWRFTESNWENDLRQLDEIREDSYHEKIRKGVADLKRNAMARIREGLSSWRNSGIHSLLEHQFRSGIISHGSLTRESVVWRDQDYYFLNWEDLSFQPRIFDLASLITSVGVWESDWIVFFIREYSRLQPFWTEEHAALQVLLKYPHNLIDILASAQTNEFERKNLKEVDKEVAKKERCLTKVWRELGSPQRWVWGKPAAGPDSGKLALSLSPVESWGDFTGQLDSLIQVNSEHKLPKDVLERLTYQDADRVYGSRDGCVLDAAAQVEEATEDIEEVPSGVPEEDLEVGEEETEGREVPSPTSEVAFQPNWESPVIGKTTADPIRKMSIASDNPVANSVSNPVPSPVQEQPQPLRPVLNPVIRWSSFPKTLGKQ